MVNGNTTSINNLIASPGADGISLREAILAANVTGGADEITFHAALSGQTISLNSTELAIAEALTIDARPLAANVTINAQQLSRIFNITATTGDFTLGGLTLTGGRTTGNNTYPDTTFSGGAIRSLTTGNLALDQSTVSGNSTAGLSTSGGGIFSSGAVTLTQSTVSGNSTKGRSFGGSGGGIWAGGAVTLTQSTVSGNTVENVGAGGGISAFGNVTLTQSTISGNSSAGTDASGGGISAFDSVTLTQSAVSGNSTAGLSARGGGIYARAVTLTQSTVSGNSTAGLTARGGGIYAGSVTLTQSTVSGNSTAGNDAPGGGIYAGPVTLTQSTVSGNSTAGSNGRGGGVTAFGSVTLTQSTVTENHALDVSSLGGGVFQVNLSLDHPFSISGSIVAGNTAAGGGADLVADPGSALTVNHSLIGTGVMPTAGGSNVVTNAPQLGPLADNGGTTLTHVLLVGSPAVNRGDPMAVAGVGDVPFFDQRGDGFPRIQHGRIDIGAYEASFTVAATLVVDTLDDELDGNIDPGDMSLREAIWAANLTADVQTITFAPALTSGGPATITLTEGDLQIRNDMSINGPGASLLTIDASGNDPTPTVNNGDGSRVFGIFQAAGTVSISDLTLTGGDMGGSGGAISNSADLTLSAVTISGNSAGTTSTGFHGGGISHSSGSLTINGSTISGNSSTLGRAGGIYSSFGSVTITDSTISGNAAGVGSAGGGIYSSYSPTTINSSTISGNSATTGGGLALAGYDIATTVTNSTISGNFATINGGGVAVLVGDLFLRHSTVTANRSDSDNNGTGSGGGLMISATFGQASADHTIVSGNFLGTATPNDAVGPVAAQSSLIAHAAPRLGPLANNGGLTQTHALLAASELLPASPAIDAGDPDAVAGVGGVPLHDQRGAPFTRVHGGRIDIGAFELQPTGPALPGDYNGNNIVDAADYVVWRDSLGTTGLPAFSGADGNGDGSVGPEDYQVWKTNFGQSLSSPGTGTALAGPASSSLASPLHETFVPLPAARTLDPAVTERVTSPAADVVAWETQTFRQSARPASGRMNHRLPTHSSADDLLLTLATDRVWRSLRPDAFTSEGDGPHEDDGNNRDNPFLIHRSVAAVLAEWP